MGRSWNAKGLVKPAWERLGLRNGRDSLAQLTGIPGTNLSSMNTGKKPMTMESAAKIADATGVSVLELGAPLSEVDAAGQSVLDRLEGLVVEAERGRAAVAASLASIDVRLSRIERRLELPEESDSAAHP